MQFAQLAKTQNTAAASFNLSNLSTLRTEAEALAKSLPRLSVQTRASEAVHLGSAGRKRAGMGEDFWEYRRYNQEDDIARIDWRRSARGDTLFVRETELETARSFYMYADAHEGFNWSSNAELTTKADRARIMMMAVANLLSREGERVGVLGSGQPAAFGKRALERFYTQIATPERNLLITPKHSGTVIIASDFYDPVEIWQARLAPIAAKCRDGILLGVADPVEVNFPFKGRTRFSRPGTAFQRILGRAETLQEEYARKFKENRTGMAALAANLGWRFITHATDETSLSGASYLRQTLLELGART